MRSRLHVVTELWIELTRRLSRLDQPHEPRFGVHVGDRLIAAAIFLGMADEQEMTASRLAAMVGLPRSTVLRRLAALEAAGAIERRGLTWRTALPTLLRLESGDLDTIAALIRARAAELE